MKITENIELKTSGKAASNSHRHIQVYEVKPVQAKISIGKGNDKYEQEADQLADQVMRMPDPVTSIQRRCEGCEEEELQTKPLSGSITPWIQTQAEEEEEETIQTKSRNQSSGEHVAGWVQSRINSSKGLGSQLPDSTRTFMENRFGTDFSQVRVHNNSNAFQLNRELNAKAFTVGRDIYFNSGQYNTESSTGMHLLAHELTHVVQQQPQLFKSPGDESESTSTFKDLETATKDIKKYMDYITECAKRSKKYGVPLPENIKKAAERIMEISQSISSKLNLVETALETVQQGLDWAKAIYAVARDIASLNLRNKASLEAFLESLDTLNNASRPAQTWAESLGRKGGAAARFSFVFSVVIVQVEIGLKTLRLGIKYIRAGQERTRRRIETEEKSTERRMKIPPLPAFPMTEEEEKEWREAIKEQERIQSERSVELMFREDFKEKEFPRKVNYPKYRAHLINQILGALLARQKKPHVYTEETAAKHDEEKWWDCLTPSNEDRRDYGGGIYLYPRKININDDDALWETLCFKAVDPTCPFFDALYDLAFEEFRRREYKNFARKIFSR